jgi:hypothetical protein
MSAAILPRGWVSDTREILWDKRLRKFEELKESLERIRRKHKPMSKNVPYPTLFADFREDTDLRYIK